MSQLIIADLSNSSLSELDGEETKNVSGGLAGAAIYGGYKYYRGSRGWSLAYAIGKGAYKGYRYTRHWAGASLSSPS